MALCNYPSYDSDRKGLILQTEVKRQCKTLLLFEDIVVKPWVIISPPPALFSNILLEVKIIIILIFITEHIKSVMIITQWCHVHIHFIMHNVTPKLQFLVLSLNLTSQVQRLRALPCLVVISQIMKKLFPQLIFFCIISLLLYLSPSVWFCCNFVCDLRSTITCSSWLSNCEQVWMIKVKNWCEWRFQTFTK